jgi:FAD/FMN-containing dehydrogenase
MEIEMTTTAARADLRQRLEGRLVEPGDADYAEASRTVFATGSPAVVVQAASPSDVRATVDFARAAGLALAVRGGGHAFAGFGTNDGGVVLDPEEGFVRIGGGATWGEVAAALAPHRLAISSGDTRSVGVGGLTLSGGIGWKVRKHGLALDALVAADVVTASGDLVRASADQHPDLFWGLRGGGGNLGVVTAFEFRAHRTGDLHFGRITFPASQAASVVHGWADHLRTATEDLTSSLVLANPMAGGAGAPVEVHVALDESDPGRAARELEPIRRLGSVLEDTVALTAYADTLVDGAVPPPGLQFRVRSAFVDPASVPGALAAVVASAAGEGAPAVAIRSLGGAAARVGDDATAYAHRRAELLVITMAAGPAPVVEAAQPRIDRLWAELGPHVHGGYANFLGAAGRAEVQAVYPAATRERPAEVKRRWDPHNLFAGNHNVGVAQSAGSAA